MTLLPLVLLATTALLTDPARAAVYEFDTRFRDYANLTEGEVFSAADSPLGISRPRVPRVQLLGSMRVKRTGDPSNDVVDRAMGIEDGGFAPQVAMHVWIFSDSVQPSWDEVCTPRGPASRNTSTASSSNNVVNIVEPGTDGSPTHAIVSPQAGEFVFNVSHVVAKTDIHYVFIKLCDIRTIDISHEYTDLNFDWATKLVFLNPYGYTPARMYGLMPFYGLNAGLIAVALLSFLALMFRHRDQLIPLHWGIAGIIVVAGLEAVLMYNAWMQVNETGPALCYPTCRAPFLAAVTMGELKSSLSRAFLLVVCMGLGVTRSGFPKKVWAAVVVLHAVYFAFSLNVDIQDVSNIVSGGTTDAVWTMPQVLSDLLIIMWIFLAISDTQRQLQKARQTLKLQMYAKLVRIMSIVVAGWFAFVTLLLLKDWGVIPWPWTYAWVWQAFAYLGYFLVLCAVAWAWGPSNVSSQLAHSQQIAMDEADASDDIELPGTSSNRIGRVATAEDINVFNLGDSGDDDDDIEDDDVKDKDAHAMQAV